MRVYEDRYHRDWQRFHVALQFIRLEARTRTIRLWTGLSDDRIRKLYRSYLARSQAVPFARHRGKSPQQTGFFLRSARARSESALFASLCRLAGALPKMPIDPGVAAPSLGRAALLCRAYETYRDLVPSPLISFERAVFLFNSLIRGEELALQSCCDCGALLVADRWSLHVPCCCVCTTHAAGPGAQ